MPTKKKQGTGKDQPSVAGYADATERIVLALEAGGIGTWEWELAAERLHWSRQMFRNLGLAYQPGSESYDLLLSAILAEDRKTAAATLAAARRRTGPIRAEIRVLWPAGEIHWLVFLGEAVADATGNPTCIRGITIDGTRRRHLEEGAETALRESEARLRELNQSLEALASRRTRQLDASRAQMQAIFDVSPDWLTLFRATPDGRFVYEDLNRATERAYGKTRDQVVGRPLEEILGREAAEIPLAHMRECVRTGENQRYTARRTMTGTTRTVDVMFARVPEKFEGDHFVMATARDITEHEAMEQRLRQAQKMETVGQLTGGVAHDFNNLLTTVIGNLELLAPRLATDLRGSTYLAAAQRASENGAKLTEQLLAFARRQHLQPQTVDLNGIVAGMREILARTIGTAIEVQTRLAPGLWPALVDPTQIEIAILNLAINSRDAMPDGGNLTIETGNCESGAEALPAELADRDCVRVSVRDTGTGMSEEVLRSAVEPFFTTKEVGKGSGLGLSQVYGMVEQSDGHMDIESELGVGTAVHLYLPRATAAAKAGQGVTAPLAAPDLPARLLVVDDDAGVREITVQMLRELGYAVTEAESGIAALKTALAGEPFGLVIIDVMMPGSSGIEVIAEIRESRPAQRALYISGYVDSAGSGPQTGGDPLLKKPFRFAELKETVASTLAAGAPETGSNIVPLRPRAG